MFKRSKSLQSSSERQFHKIISVNAYRNLFYEFRENTLLRVDKLSYDKRNIVVSTIDTKDFITSVVEISVNIPPEDLKDAIELKAYDDLGLDPAAEYIIRYVEAIEKRNDKYRYFHVFVAEPEVVHETFEPVAKRLKYIDYIFPKPYLIRNLYYKDILEPYGVHGFLYFQKEDAFLALFKEGEYLYSKSIKYSFENIYERFCELYGERVDEEAFFEMLQREGLKTSNFEWQDQLMKLFSEIFLYISDIIIFAKKAYEFDHIDLFYTGSDVGPILGLNEYAHTYLGFESIDFDFDYGIEQKDWYVDQFHPLSIIESIRVLEGEEAPNFTLFFRPPPFLLRRSGQFIVTTIVAVMLALALPIYNYSYDIFIKMKNKKLTQEEKQLSLIVNSLRVQIAQLEQRKSAVLGKIKAEKELFDKKKKILTAIYDKKVNYPMKAKHIVQLGNDMSRFKVKVTKVVDRDNSFILSLYADSDKKITQYIKYLADHYGNKIHTDIDKIYKDEKTGIYHGDLKVDIR